MINLQKRQKQSNYLKFYKGGPEDEKKGSVKDKAWKVMVVDDEEVLHQITKMILEDFSFKGRPIEISSAYSAAEAKRRLEQNPDTAVMLLDVVMETEHAGLDLVKYIRDVIGNRKLRIILRTGQPGQAPETEVINNYDINDYKEKADLTALKLISSLTTALRSYDDLVTIEQLSISKEKLEQEVSKRTHDLAEANARLQQARDELEKKVQERTAQLYEAKTEAERASEAKTVFLSRMSHELRTPLNAILGFTQLLLDDAHEPLTDEQRTNASEVLSAGHHLLRLVTEVLDMTRIESGNIQLNLEPLSVRYFLKACQRTLEPVAHERGQRIVLECADESLNYTIMADEVRLKQVIYNLISNAIKFNRPNGTVTLRCDTAAEDIMRFRVIDEGPGIRKEDQHKIFDAFERLGADKMCIEGVGIGLTISKQFVELMGGRIGVHSESGKGSEFWVDVPRVS